MAGPDIEGSDFHRYIKTEELRGSESRELAWQRQGGATTVSDLRAIFVSTRFLEEGSLESLSQGRTTLMSHSMGEFKFGHLGYWAVKDLGAK